MTQYSNLPFVVISFLPQSLVEVAKQKLSHPKQGLEEILRPDNPDVIHSTGLVPNHSTFCELRDILWVLLVPLFMVLLFGTCRHWRCRYLKCFYLRLIEQQLQPSRLNYFACSIFIKFTQSLLGTGLTHPDKVQEIVPNIPRQSEIPPPEGWRITGYHDNTIVTMKTLLLPCQHYCYHDNTTVTMTTLLLP